MQLEVYEKGNLAGTLTVGQDGLYRVLRCVCRPQTDGILRLYVWNGKQGRCLGVLCPEGGDFTLQKRCSETTLPFTPETAVLGCEDDGFLPWRGSFEGKQVAHGYLKHTEVGDCLAVPYAEGMEDPFAEHRDQTLPQTLCGEACLVYQPWLPKKQAPQPEIQAAALAPEEPNMRFHGASQ